MTVKKHLLTFNRLPVGLCILGPLVLLICLELIGLDTATSCYIMAPFLGLGTILMILGQIIGADCPECNGPCKLKLGGVRYSISYLCKNCDYKFRLKI